MPLLNFSSPFAFPCLTMSNDSKTRSYLARNYLVGNSNKHPVVSDSKEIEDILDQDSTR